MEAGSDPFAGGVDAPEGDPFDQKPEEFQQGDDPFATGSGEATEQPVEGVPVVDKEGEPVNGATASSEAAPASTQDAPTPKNGDAASSEAAEQDRSLTEAAAEAAEAAQEAVEEPPKPDPSPAEGESSGEPGEADGATPEPQAAADDGEAQPQPPEERQGDKVIRRAYRILVPKGYGKWEDVTWYEDKTGKMVEKGAEGAIKRSEALVRGQAEALKIGYRAMGGTGQPIKLVAVPVSYFQVKTVEPDTVPARVKLRIS